MSMLRVLFVCFFGAIISSAAVAKEDVAPPAKAAEYHRPDPHLYYRPTVVKADPAAVIVPKESVTQKGDSWFLVPHKKAPKELYVETSNDWIEPITPPGATSALAIGPDEMVIREPQGDVRVALPSAPANFTPVNDGMTLPNGAVLKTGDGATAAVLFGGVFSARLMPNSEAALQQTVTPTARTVEVDLTSGGVFSKVGQQVGVKSEYEVHTPSGIASASGGDFVTLALQGHTDVWAESGTVSFLTPDSKTPQTVTADGTGPLQALRCPPPTQTSTAISADADALTAMFGFIPMANLKIKVLRDRAANGAPLSDVEQAYLARIKQVPALMKLALVPPPTPVKPVVPKPKPLASAPMPLREAAPTTNSAAPVPPVPEPAPTAPAAPAAASTESQTNAIGVFPSGKVRFHGEVLSLEKFKAKMADAVKASPQEIWKIHYFPNVPREKANAAADAAKAAGADKIIVELWAKGQTSGTPGAKPTAEAAPAVAAAPAVPATPTPPAEPAAEGMTPGKALPPAKPETVTVHASGTIRFLGQTVGLKEFDAKLRKLVKDKPDQELIIKSGTKVPYDKLKAVLDSCADAQVRHVTVTQPAPTPPPLVPDAPTAPSPVPPPAGSPTSATPQSPAFNLPSPELRMHPSVSLETAPTDAPSTNAPSSAQPAPGP